MIKLLFALGAICVGARLLARDPRRTRTAACRRRSLAAAIAVATFAARADGRRPAGAAAVAGQLGRARRQRRRRPSRDRGRAGAVRRRERLGRARSDARRARRSPRSRPRSAFWPRGHRGASAASSALILLIAAYAIPIALYPPGRAARSGACVLLVLVGRLALDRPPAAARGEISRSRSPSAPGCWRCRSRRAPATSRCFDYKNWDWFGGSASVAFRVEPRVRAARLAARRGDDALGRDRPPAVLEGERPRSLRRLSLAARQHARSAPRSPSAARAGTPRSARSTSSIRAGSRRRAFTIDGLRTNLVIGAGAPLAVDRHRRRSRASTGR